MGDKSSSKTMITANICVGCCDMNGDDDPDKTHYCREAAEKGIKHGFVPPMVVTYAKGEKCRDKLCEVRRAVSKNKAA